MLSLCGKYALGYPKDDPSDMEGISMMQSVSLKDALTTHYPTDQHIVCYTLPGKEIPRLRKRLADGDAQDRQILAGLRFTALFIDVDNPAHAAWTPALREDFDARLADLPEPLSRFGYVYYTAHGARLVYVYTEPIGHQDQEAHAAGVAAALVDHGITADLKCADWTRTMRLPYVTRDGKQSDGQLVTTGLQVDAGALPRQEPTDKAKPASISMDRPSDDRAQSLARRVEWNKSIKARLRGIAKTDHRPYYYSLLVGEAIADSGDRNDAIQRMVGALVKDLRGYASTTPEHIYGLALPSVRTMEEQTAPQDEDFCATLWASIVRYWTQDAAKDKRQDAAQQDVWEGLIAKVRRWWKLPEDYYEARAAVSQMLVVRFPKKFNCFMNLDTGTYSNTQFGRDVTGSCFDSFGYDKIVSLKTDGKRIPDTELLRRHGTVVEDITYRVGMTGSILEHSPEGKIILCQKMYALRTDIDPEWSADVDTWLQKFGGENYETLCQWIGLALEFGYPICALSISGPKSIGKKLLAVGLAETVDATQKYATDEELTGHFQHNINKTAFMVVNEGWSQLLRNRTTDLTESFRRVVTGDAIKYEQKGLDATDIRNPMRVLMTANSDTVVRELFGKIELTKADIKALSERVFHFQATDEAAVWLEEKGGNNFTRGWIAGDDGSPGKLVIAKHFLMLHQMAEEEGINTSGRLLMSGNLSSKFQLSMAMGSDIAESVVEAVFAVVNDEGTRYRKGVCLSAKRGTLHITTQQVLEAMRKITPGIKASKASVSHALGCLHPRGLDSLNVRKHTLKYDDGSRTRRYTWRELDIDLLIDEAVERGLDYTRLAKIKERVSDEKIIRDARVSG